MDLIGEGSGTWVGIVSTCSLLVTQYFRVRIRRTGRRPARCHLIAFIRQYPEHNVQEVCVYDLQSWDGDAVTTFAAFKNDS